MRRLIRWLLISMVATTGICQAVDCYEEIDPYYWTIDVDALIHIADTQQVSEVRENIIDYLWAGRGLPTNAAAVTVERMYFRDEEAPVPPTAYDPGEPTNYPGLCLWLDSADAGTITLSNGVDVVEWRDKSALGNHAAQTNVVRRPQYSGAINGVPAIQFDGVDDYLSVPDDASLDVRNITVFLVVELDRDDNVSYPIFLVKEPVNTAYVFFVNAVGGKAPTLRCVTEAAAWKSTGDTIAAGTEPQVLTADYDGSFIEVHRDGVLANRSLGVEGAVASTSGNLLIGGRDAVGNALDGAIAEVILYNRALTDSERQQIEDYLSQKYAIPDRAPAWLSQIRDENLGSVEHCTIEMDYGLRSYAYLLRPARPVNRLILFQQGHSQSIVSLENDVVLRNLLKEGFTVLAFWMPLFGENPYIVDVPGIGNMAFHTHNEMVAYLEDGQGSFIRFFVEPVVAALSYIGESETYRDINMMGISGGGWTTHLCAALDTRIEYSFPTAGSLPLYLRSGPCPNGSQGDAEQTFSALYVDTASWLDVYTLGGYGVGRRQVQILNQYDSCCFYGINYQTYEPTVASVVQGLGAGGYNVFLDSTHWNHKISTNALQNCILPILKQKMPRGTLISVQ